MGDIAQLNFSDQQASGLEQLAGAPPLIANSLTDLSGTRRSRPGISAWSSFPAQIPNSSPVMAMTPLGDLIVYVTADRRLWSCTTDGVVTALSNGTLASMLDGTLRPQVLSLRSQVVIVGGGVPQATDGTGTSARLGGSPPASSAIAALATRIILAPWDTSGIFRWSGLGDTGHATWDALDFAEAEAKPDYNQNIASNTNELFVFGTETLQVFSPDPNVAFAPGRTLNIGLLAPSSLVNVDDQFAFLDRDRRFVITDGRSFSDEDSVISKTIESDIRGMVTVDDCWGFRMRTGRWDACVWFFPTEGRGFVWNRRNRGWSEWRARGMTGWISPNITSALYWPEQNLFLVGLSSGQIAKLDADAFTDLGEPLRVELISGFADSGTQNLKKYIAAKFRFKRGQAAQGSTVPKVSVYRRTDLGSWGDPTVRDMGLAGDYEPVVEIRSLGTGRQIQFKLEYEAAAEFTLVGATIETQTLDN